MLTKNGIELNLKESNYVVNLTGLSFYFSSELYKNKFINNVKEFVNQENTKINLKYKLQINLETYLAIAFYKKVEKRGFYITADGQELKNIQIINEIIKV